MTPNKYGLAEVVLKRANYNKMYLFADKIVLDGTGNIGRVMYDLVTKKCTPVSDYHWGIMSEDWRDYVEKPIRNHKSLGITFQ